MGDEWRPIMLVLIAAYSGVALGYVFGFWRGLLMVTIAVIAMVVAILLMEE